MKVYAKGSKAWGICQRCGMRHLLSELVNDGRIPGLRVHPECYEPFQQQERPIDVSDPMLLRKPSPEVSIEPGHGIPAPDLEDYVQ